MIHSVIHHRGGPIFFALSLIPLFLLLWWLRRGEIAPNSVHEPGMLSPNLQRSLSLLSREKTIMQRGQLVLADGSTITGEHFGAPVSSAGEVVFNTGMVGYPEAMTDPSYRGQILVLTYPLIGNYGVPVNGNSARPGNPELHALESGHIQISGLVVSTLAREYSHWTALASLDSWLKQSGVPALCGVDTRALTKKLRIQGCMLGKLLCEEEDTPWDDPNRRNLVAEVSLGRPRWYPTQGKRKVILVDLGCKESILRCLLKRELDVLRVPWNFDWSQEEADGIVLSNGPGDPKMCAETISLIRTRISAGTFRFLVFAWAISCSRWLRAPIPPR